MSTSYSTVLEDLDPAQVLSLAEVAAVLPGRRPGRPMNAKVVLRWVIHGVRGHRLRTLRIGHRHRVRIADLGAFLDAITPGAAAAAARPSKRAAMRLRARRAALARRAAEEALR